jgi:hypothetical protein
VFTRHAQHLGKAIAMKRTFLTPPEEERERFIAWLQPIIDTYEAGYRADPLKFFRELPILMHCHCIERSRNKKFTQSALMARCLVATHRLPTAAYMGDLMHTVHSPSSEIWHPLRDARLRSLLD